MAIQDNDVVVIPSEIVVILSGPKGRYEGSPAK
jgi:hypothetical protein